MRNRLEISSTNSCGVTPAAVAAFSMLFWTGLRSGELLALTREDFDIVPFPIGRPELMRFYIPDGTRIFVTILDEWGRCKTDRLRDFGYPVEVLWERTDKVISSSMIRRCIIEDRPWAQYVPPATYRYVLQKKIDLRIKELGSGS